MLTNPIRKDWSIRIRIKKPAMAAALVVLLFLVAACGGSDSAVTGNQSATETTPPTQRSESSPTAGVTANSSVANVDRKVGGEVGDLAPEFGGIEAWINGGPLTMEELRGQVVLIDFWTYTCINCIRTFPFLKQWNSRYADDGLVIVGVHSPEFEFEKDYDNVVEATQNEALAWTMAQDNDFVTWRRYNNRFWPAKYLIDKDSVIRYTHFGEGGYAETEDLIRELLAEADPNFLTNDLPLPEDQTVDPAFLIARDAEVTRELYGGYERSERDLLFGRGGYVQQMQYFDSKDQIANFSITEDQQPHKIYFEGAWHVGAESSTHGRMTEWFEDYLALVYSATSVNAVLTSASGEPYKVRITVDDEYLTDFNKGSDIIIGDDGESYLWVTSPSLYNVISNDSYVRRQNLKMASNSPDFGLFAFTFGVYDTGP
ncbi:MAG: redoxin domain-containing protein [Dehalococcoidia bacterium]|nr:redoxin domain-containing protein [Dehalococcoidia bacterium]